MELHTAKQIVHVPVPQIQEQSAVTSLISPQISFTAVEAPQVVGSFPLSEDFAAPMYNHVHQEKSLQQYSRKLFFRKFFSFRLLSGFRNKIVETIEVFPQEQIEGQIGYIPVPQEQLIAEVTTLNTSSTSTSSSSTSTRSDVLAKMLDNLKKIEKEVERAAMLTKRLMEPPLPEPPMVESDRTSAKRCRRTRYTPLPGIMENAVYLAASAWPPIRHA